MKKKLHVVKRWWEEDRCISWILSYSFIAIIVLAGVYYTFIRTNTNLIWKQDGLYSYLPTFAYGGHYIREVFQNLLHGEFALPLYDFSYGMGMNVYSIVLEMFTDPFRLISVVFPMSKADVAYNISVLLRFYCAGLTFVFFCRFKKCNRIGALTGAIIYMASGYALYSGMKHPQFMTALVILPLLFIGVEKLLCNKSKFFYIILVFSMINSYYFTFMMSFVIAIYMLFRFFDIYKENRLKIFITLLVKTIIGYLLAIGMAAFAYFPQIVNFLNSYRTGEVIGTDSFIYYDLQYYKDFISHLFSPLNSAGYWVYTGFAPIALLVIIYLLVKRNKEYRSDRYLLLVFTAMLCLPICAYVLSGFNSISNRWCYGYTFMIALLVAKYTKKLATLTKRELVIFSTATIFSGLLIIITSEVSSKFTVAEITMLLVSLFVVLLFHKIELKKKYFEYVMLFVVIINVVIYARCIYSVGNFVDTFAKRGEGIEELLDSPYKQLEDIDDNSFYRVEQIKHAFASGHRGLVVDLNTTAQYSNINKAFFNKFNESVLNAGIKDIVMVYDLDGRTILNTLASVKYYAINSGQEQYLPYGYELVSKSKKYSVYKNKYTLPLGYTYDQYIEQREYDALSALDKQNAMLYAAVVDETSQQVKHITSEEITNSSSEVPVLDMSLKNVDIKGNTINVKKKNGKITLSFNGVSNAETYVLLKNLCAVDDFYYGNISIEYNGVKKTNPIQGKSAIYKSPKDDYLTNIGQVQEGTQSVTIIFKTPGVFTFDGIELLSQSLEAYGNAVEKLKQETLENINMGNDCITGDITVSENKLLCFSIPYDEGWTLTIDGHEEELVPLNGMYMGTEVEQGNHSVKLVYHVKGLKLGFIVTLLTICVTVLLEIVVKSKKKWYISNDIY